MADNNMQLRTTEMHVAGEPLRILEGGFPEIKGKSLSGKVKYMREHLDQIRKLIVFEPRGRFDMYGAVLVEPDKGNADVGVIFMDNEVYAPMCGHSIIGIGRYIVDRGIVKPPVSPETKVVVQCLCGLVDVFVTYSNGKAGSVRFHSVPSYVFALGLKVDIPNYGTVVTDISFGGAFFAVLPAKNLGLDLMTSSTHDLVRGAEALKDALKKTVTLTHPENKDITYFYGVVLTDGRDEEDETANFSVYGGAALDRAPCGGATIARVALQYNRKQVSMGESKTFRGPVGGNYKAKPVRETKFGPYDAIVVEVSGKGYYTGSCTFTREDDDEIGKGFLLK